MIHLREFTLTNIYIKVKAKCVDCEQVGHYNENYYKCKFYKEASANDDFAYIVGGLSNKRKQSSTIKQEKKAFV